MMGPGKYDSVASAARHICVAEGVVLIVFNGLAGSGFQCQLPPKLAEEMPKILREVAEQIERDLQREAAMNVTAPPPGVTI